MRRRAGEPTANLTSHSGASARQTMPHSRFDMFVSVSQSANSSSSDSDSMLIDGPDAARSTPLFVRITSPWCALWPLLRFPCVTFHAFLWGPISHCRLFGLLLRWVLVGWLEHRPHLDRAQPSRHSPCAFSDHQAPLRLIPLALTRRPPPQGQPMVATCNPPICFPAAIAFISFGGCEA